MSDQIRLHTRINNVLQKRIELLEKEIDLQKEAGKTTSAAEAHLSNVQKIQKRVNEAFEYATDVVKRYASMLGTAALAHRAYAIATSSSKGATEQFLLTAQSLDKASTSYAAIAKRAKAYQKVMAEEIRIAQKYGLELDHVRAVSNSWMKTMRFTVYNDKNIKKIKELTDKTLVYAKVIGIDSSELVQKASHRMFQYGESADSAMDNILGLYGATQAVNKSIAKLTGKNPVLWAEDFSKLVEEAASNTQNFTQDIGMLSAAMADSVKNAAKAGETYNATLEAGRAMGKFITGGGENAMSSVIGLRMLEKLKKARGKDGKLSADFLKDFNESQKADMQKVADMVGTTNEKDLALYLSDSAATSKAGIRELLRLTEELGSKTGDIVPILEQQRGLTRAQALEMAHQLKMAKNVDEVMDNITSQYESQKAETEQIKANTEGMTAIMRAESGKVTTVPWIDETLEKLDVLTGEVKAHFTDAGTVMKYAFIAGLLSLVQFLRTANSLRTTLSSVASAARVVAAETQAAAAAATVQAAATAKTQRNGAATAITAAETAAAGGLLNGAAKPLGGMLAPYSIGNALRVFVTNSGAIAAMGGATSHMPTVPIPVGGGGGPIGGEQHAPTGGPHMPAPTGSPAGGGGWRSRIGSMASNPMAIMAAYTAADYMLSSNNTVASEAQQLGPDGNPIETPEKSTIDKLKGMGSDALNAVMMWWMLGSPGKETAGKAISGLMERFGAAGSGGVGRVAGGFMKQVMSRFATGGIAEAGASSLGGVSLLGAGAALGAGSLAAGAIVAPMYYAAKSGETPERLRTLSHFLRHPVRESDIDSAMKPEILRYLAANPREAAELVSEGVLDGKLLETVAGMSSMGGSMLRQSAISSTAPARSYSGYDTGQPSRQPQQQYGSSTGSSIRVAGAKGSGSISDVSPDGRTRIVVPMEIEINNGFQLPAAYDKAKAAAG